jgi:hypothetical protein
MKKSEMVSILKGILQDTELAAWASCEAASFLDSLVSRDADKIMQAIDKSGMLPPLRSVTIKDDFWDKAICAEMDGMEIKVSQWDKE